MRCFNHGDREAVGSCKACHKGLCHECATDMGHGLACKATHEAMVETYNSIIQKNARLYGAATKGRFGAPLFYAFMGVVFGGYGLFARDHVETLLVILGGGFIAFSLFCYLQGKKVFGQK